VIRPLGGVALFALLGVTPLGCDDGFLSFDDTGNEEADADTDTDADSDSDVEVDCDEDLGTPPIGGSDCVSDTLGCGDTIVSTTLGGSNAFDGDDYQTWFCAIATENDYDGPERVYTFEHPGTGDVTFSLSTPCEDLDLVVMAWADASCPTSDTSINECEIASGGGSSDSVTIWNPSKVGYLVVVEGLGGEEAPFALSAACP
jgi:hypothetical protein